MSSRTALRWGAVEALRPSDSLIAAGTVFPTIARDRVFDSRIDLIANAQSPEDIEAALTALENKPLLVVYTEEHSKHPYGADTGVKYPAKENVVVLVVEALIGIKGIVEIGMMPDGVTPITEGTLATPATDHANEAILDFLDAQVCRALSTSGRDVTGTAFRAAAWEYREYHSTPQRAADRTFRLASRTLKFHIKVADETWPIAPATGLPEPMAKVVALLPPDSYVQPIAAQLAGLACGDPPIPVPGPTQVAIYAGLGRVPTATAYDVLAAAGTPPLTPTPSPPTG